MAAPKRIDELTAVTSLSAAAAVAIVQGGQTLRATAAQFITEAPSYTASGNGAIARAVQDVLRERISVLDFIPSALHAGIAARTSTTDVATYVQAAIDAAQGKPLYVPSGTYIIGTQLTFVQSSLATKNAGLILIGDGREKTIFDNRVASNAMLKLDTGTNSKWQWGGYLKGFQIKTTTIPASSDGIYIRRQQALTLEDIYITGLTGDGVEIELATGDADGTTGLTFRHCWIASCAGWGINCNLASGTNELSFLTMENTRVESCGTDDAGASPPTSGGMRYKGQVAFLRDGTCFVTNENVGMYVVGAAGASNSLEAVGVTWENNKEQGLWIATLSGGQFIGCQFYNNDSFLATNCVNMTAATGALRKIRFQGTIIRSTTGNNPITAFTLSGDWADCSVHDTHWDTFDGTGQTRFSVSSAALGFYGNDDGIHLIGTSLKTSAARGEVVLTNNKSIRGANSAANDTFSLMKLNASDELEVASTSIRTKFPGYTHIRVVATASLPAAAAAMDGAILIEDNGTGDRNVIIYAGGQRFRIDGGAAF